MRHLRKHSRSNGHDLASNWVRIKGAVTEAIDDVRDTTEEMMHDSVNDIKKTSARAQNKVASYTAKRPFKSLGIALLAGALVGYLILRRR